MPTSAPNRRALVAFLALAACAACGSPPPPKALEVAPPMDAGSVSAPVAIVDAAPAPVMEAVSDAGKADSCAVKKATLTRSPEDEHQCLEGTAPRAADLRVAFTPRSPTVGPGGRVMLDVRITNVSDHTVSVRTELPLSESLVVTNDKSAAIAPPAGPMPITPNPKCGAMTCSHVTIPRGVVVALLPGGVIEDTVIWQASHVAWPPARPQNCLASCMGTDKMIPVATKPLSAGTYHVQTGLRAWSQPEWLVLPITADVVVR